MTEPPRKRARFAATKRSDPGSLDHNSEAEIKTTEPPRKRARFAATKRSDPVSLDHDNNITSASQAVPPSLTIEKEAEKDIPTLLAAITHLWSDPFHDLVPSTARPFATSTPTHELIPHRITNPPQYPLGLITAYHAFAHISKNDGKRAMKMIQEAMRTRIRTGGGLAEIRVCDIETAQNLYVSKGGKAGMDREEGKKPVHETAGAEVMGKKKEKVVRKRRARKEGEFPQSKAMSDALRRPSGEATWGWKGKKWVSWGGGESGSE